LQYSVLTLFFRVDIIRPCSRAALIQTEKNQGR
jgi:hypothetical protein